MSSKKLTLVGGWRYFIYEQETLPPTRAMKFVYTAHVQHGLNMYPTAIVTLGLKINWFSND